MKSRTCNKFVLNSDCSFTIQNEEFKDGYVYVYVFQLKPIREKMTIQTLVRTSKFQDVTCTIKKDGHYEIYVAEIPSNLYKNGKFINGEEEFTAQEAGDLFRIKTYNYFSICLLRQCYINICKSIFDSRGSIECKSINVDKELTYKRDLVWASLNVIEYLTDMCQYREAQRILERITGCNGLCKEHRQKGGGCGCG